MLFNGKSKKSAEQLSLEAMAQTMRLACEAEIRQQIEAEYSDCVTIARFETACAEAYQEGRLVGVEQKQRELDDLHGRLDELVQQRMASQMEMANALSRGPEAELDEARARIKLLEDAIVSLTVHILPDWHMRYLEGLTLNLELLNPILTSVLGEYIEYSSTNFYQRKSLKDDDAPHREFASVPAQEAGRY